MTVLHNWKSSGTWLADHRQVQPSGHKRDNPNTPIVNMCNFKTLLVLMYARLVEKKIKAEN